MARTPIPGPWVAETSIPDDTEERGLAVIAVLPELAHIPHATPTRGMVCWVASGTGACATDQEAIGTAHLIAAVPDLLASLRQLRDCAAMVANRLPDKSSPVPGRIKDLLLAAIADASAAIEKADSDA